MFYARICFTATKIACAEIVQLFFYTKKAITSNGHLNNAKPVKNVIYSTALYTALGHRGIIFPKSFTIIALK